MASAVIAAAAMPAAADETAAQVIKIACVGDSLTEGVGAAAGKSYPDQLRAMLGDGYDVRNYGVSGTSATFAATQPYRETSAYKRSVELEPDMVFIMLGTNDANPVNWTNKNRYVANYLSLIETYRSLPSTPAVYVLTSPFVGENAGGYSNETTVSELLPLQYEVAARAGCGLVDIYALTENHAEWLTDGVHMNAQGYERIAACVFNAMENGAPVPTLPATTAETLAGPQTTAVTPTAASPSETEADEPDGGKTPFVLVAAAAAVLVLALAGALCYIRMRRKKQI